MQDGSEERFRGEECFWGMGRKMLESECFRNIPCDLVKGGWEGVGCSVLRGPAPSGVLVGV